MSAYSVAFILVYKSVFLTASTFSSLSHRKTQFSEFWAAVVFSGFHLVSVYCVTSLPCRRQCHLLALWKAAVDCVPSTVVLLEQSLCLLLV